MQLFAHVFRGLFARPLRRHRATGPQARRFRRRKRRRPTAAERRLRDENRRLEQELDELRDRFDTTRQKLRAARVTADVHRAEIRQLWSLVARDRQRVKAETAAATHKLAQFE